MSNRVAMVQTSYRHLLKKDFERRIRRNSNYSLRAYARDLGLSASRLSEIFSGKQGLSRRTAEKVGVKVGYSRENLTWFCDLVESEDGRSHLTRELAKLRLLDFERTKTMVRVDNDVQEKIEWYDFVIRRLTQVSNFSSDPEWIARKLGLGVRVVKESIERLVGLKLLTRDENAKLSIAENVISSSVSQGARERYLTLLMKSFESVKQVPPEKRYHGYHFFAINSKRLNEFIALIREFEERIDQLTYEVDPTDSIYMLNTSFFPLTQDTSEE